MAGSLDQEQEYSGQGRQGRRRCTQGALPCLVYLPIYTTPGTPPVHTVRHGRTSCTHAACHGTALTGALSESDVTDTGVTVAGVTVAGGRLLKEEKPEEAQGSPEESLRYTKVFETP